MTLNEFIFETLFINEDEVMSVSLLYGFEVLETLRKSTDSASFAEALSKSSDWQLRFSVFKTMNARVFRVIANGPLWSLCPWVCHQEGKAFLEGLDAEEVMLLNA